MNIGVVTFPGSNCDADARYASALTGNTVHTLWHKDTSLPSSLDVIILPGGFSYGDYLRTGAIARFSPIMEEVIRFAHGGGYVFGICNGFQILCESGLLPGALIRNEHLSFVCKDIHLRIEKTDSPFTNCAGTGDVVRIPVAHGEGRYTAPADVLSVAQVFPKAVLQRSAVENILTKTRGDRWVFDRANVDNFSEGAGSEALLWLNEVIPIIGDRTSWVSAVWNVSTARNSRAFGSKCQARVKNSFLGVVSTNATAYSEGPPRYNESTATLEYEVAAPHFLPDGKTEAIGRYALNLNADFMTCLLGVSKVPDQAKIELTYGTGEVNAATINVKQTKNWLTLIAENFTYSSPRIKVSFPQAATATTKTVAKSKAPAKTVTCVKGKTAKKFLGTKCPRGWKKK